MKFLLKWLFRLGVLLLLALVLLAISFDALVTAFSESRLRKQTGLEVHVGKISVRPWRGRAHVENLVIFNPAEFGGGALIDIAEIHVEYDPALTRERKLHLNVLRFNLAELNIVIDKSGQSNLDGVRRTVESIRTGKRPANTNAPMEFAGLDLMNLTLNKASWTDLRVSGTPRVFDLGVHNEVVQNVKDAPDLVAKLTPILVRAGLSFFGVGQTATTAATTNRPPAALTNEALLLKR